jgi:hypothetical protein
MAMPRHQGHRSAATGGASISRSIGGNKRIYRFVARGADWPLSPTRDADTARKRETDHLTEEKQVEAPTTPLLWRRDRTSRRVLGTREAPLNDDAELGELQGFAQHSAYLAHFNDERHAGNQDEGRPVADRASARPQPVHAEIEEREVDRAASRDFRRRQISWRDPTGERPVLVRP